jgi:nitrite reductase (NO-forming)
MNNDGFWYKAWQFALLFAVMAMMAATILVQDGDLSPADVREILAEEGVAGGTAVETAYPADQSILPELTPVAQLAAAPAAEEHLSRVPAVPPTITRSDQRIWKVHFESIEGVCPLDPANGISTEMWGFRIAGETEVVCGSPGPVLRGRVGDVVEISLTNMAGNQHPHNIDFHAVTGQGGGAEDLTVAPGETATIQVRLLYPGAFMYHCAFGDVPMHIAHGMYGMFIVDPETPLPAVDHEWAIVQSEWYVGPPDASGVAPFDPDSLFLEEPRFVTFNGRTDALTGENALQMAVGERARIYMVNEGLNLNSNFHPIGSHWDSVYPEAATHPANRVIRGSQSTLVVAGGGTVVEMQGLVPSTVILVDHALVRTFYKGAIGLVNITGDENPELFAEVAAGTGDPQTTTTAAAVPSVGEDEVVIPEGAWDPNAEYSFFPGDLTVSVGTTVTWTNRDQVVHTVTSGSSDGTVGQPDGLFDSGLFGVGETFQFTFTEPGTYSYFCTPHPWMQGSVTVTG